MLSVNALASQPMEAIHPTADPTILMRSYLLELKKASLYDINQGHCDEIFAQALPLVTNREQAQDLAYALFSGEKYRTYGPAHNFVKGLAHLLLDKKLSETVLCKVIKRAFDTLKTENISPTEKETASPKTLPNWLGYSSTPQENDADILVLVSHGGGKRHIAEFFNQESTSGYRCDSSIQGIFVTPFVPSKTPLDLANLKKAAMSSRAPNYATRTPLRHCDNAHVIVGHIPKKYLYAVNHNSYEAVIKKEDASFFTKVFEETIEGSIGQLNFLDFETFSKEFSNDPDLETEIAQSLNRLV
jgi:hypothetical protein